MRKQNKNKWVTAVDNPTKMFKIRQKLDNQKNIRICQD
jgi:hypothetical protein